MAEWLRNGLQIRIMQVQILSGAPYWICIMIFNLSKYGFHILHKGSKNTYTFSIAFSFKTINKLEFNPGFVWSIGSPDTEIGQLSLFSGLKLYKYSAAPETKWRGA